MYGWIDGQTDRQTDRQTESQTNAFDKKYRFCNKI